MIREGKEFIGIPTSLLNHHPPFKIKLAFLFISSSSSSSEPYFRWAAIRPRFNRLGSVNSVGVVLSFVDRDSGKEAKGFACF
ncbi:hypothetical protein MLD38_025028 [Melastoma candidum]|uniref:Uncharacterized protein n=1 Tax=Melastoma candidum TaxID=119954 RepID=A0ACB9NU38_9MYRT|nr:hypothetical protein MLD38_025028 [Melastoma candidum]